MLVILLLAAAGLAGGCQSRNELHVSYHPWIGYETLPLARELGWLPDNVVLHRQQSSAASARALAAGEVQVAALTLDEALRLRAALPDLKVVLVMNESAGADVLLARPTFTDLHDLAGARVAYESSAVSELLLRSALASVDLSLGDLELVDLPIAEHAAAYRDGEVDAVVSFPPVADKVQALGAKTLFDSSQIPGTILDVLVMNPQQFTGYRGALSATITAHFRALEHLRANRDDAIYRLAALQQTTAADIRAALAGVRLPALVSVQDYLRPGGTVQTTAEMLVEGGLLGDAGAVIELSDLADTRFLPRDATQ